jgi:hypothetical protein
MDLLEEYTDDGEQRIRDADVEVIEKLLDAPAALVVGALQADAIKDPAQQSAISAEIGVIMGYYTEAVYILGFDRGAQEMFEAKDNKDTPARW